MGVMISVHISQVVVGVVHVRHGGAPVTQLQKWVPGTYGAREGKATQTCQKDEKYGH